jgi:hypothetical protein
MPDSTKPIAQFIRRIINDFVGNDEWPRVYQILKEECMSAESPEESQLLLERFREAAGVSTVEELDGWLTDVEDNENIENIVNEDIE